MPSLTFETLDAVPEGLREFASEVDGKITVKVVPETKLSEFREKNITLSQERDKLDAQARRLAELVGEDPDAFAAELQELRETAQKVKDGQLKASDDVEAVVRERVAKMKEEYEQQVRQRADEAKAWQGKAATIQQQYDRSIIDQNVTRAVVDPKVGALPEALPDILSRAYGVFTVENGKLVAKAGDAVIYGSDGTTPLSPAEWLNELKQTASYFFKGSTGGGAAGNGPGTIAGMSKAEFAKLSPQEKLRLANSGKV